MLCCTANGGIAEIECRTASLIVESIARQSAMLLEKDHSRNCHEAPAPSRHAVTDRKGAPAEHGETGDLNWQDCVCGRAGIAPGCSMTASMNRCDVRSTPADHARSSAHIDG